MIYYYGGPSKQSSGTYIDNVGIYVCGGHFNNFLEKGRIDDTIFRNGKIFRKLNLGMRNGKIK